MSNYYQTTLEQVAEWFMQLFFDPMYHVESVIRKNDVMIKTQASMHEVKATPNVDQDQATNNFVQDGIVVVGRFLAKFKCFKKPELHFITYLNQLTLENLWIMFRLKGFNMAMQQI